MGIWTLAEMLVQVTEPPVDAVARDGFRLRLVLPGDLPNAFPPVWVWSDGLSFGIPRDILERILAEETAKLGQTLDEERQVRVFTAAFPTLRVIVPAGIEYVAQAENGEPVRFERAVQAPCPYKSFHLQDPRVHGTVEVPLRIVGNELQVTVPDDLVRGLRAACVTALAK